MRGGTLRHRVTLQEKSPTRSAYHDELPGWTDLAANAEVWAAKEPLQGREFFDARRAGAEQPVWFRIRYRSDVTPAMRLVHGSELYDIVSVVEVEGRQRELRLMCNRIIPEAAI